FFKLYSIRPNPRFMKSITSVFVLLLTFCSAFSQKRPLDPSVYDGWQRIGGRMLTSDGKYIAYTVVPEEGDGRLYIRATAGGYSKEIPRGAGAAFTADGRFIVFQIRPPFKD